jgi:hypothetical protein
MDAVADYSTDSQEFNDGRDEDGGEQEEFTFDASAVEDLTNPGGPTLLFPTQPEDDDTKQADPNPLPQPPPNDDHSGNSAAHDQEADSSDGMDAKATEASKKSDPKNILAALRVISKTWLGDVMQTARSETLCNSAQNIADLYTAIVGNGVLPLKEAIERSLRLFRMFTTGSKWRMNVQEECLSLHAPQINGKYPQRRTSSLLKYTLTSIFDGLIHNPNWLSMDEEDPLIYYDLLTTNHILAGFIPFIEDNRRIPTDTQLLVMFIGLFNRFLTAGDPTSLVDFGLKCLFYPFSSSAVNYLANIKKAVGMVAGCDIHLAREWEHVLRWQDEMVEARRSSAAASISNKMTAVIEIPPELVIKTLKRWCENAEKGHFLSGWLAVQLSTGCRVAEVISPKVDFSVPHVGPTVDDDPELYIVQNGQVKEKVTPVEGRKSNLKPILRFDGGWKAQDIVRMSKAIRASVEADKSKKLTESSPAFWNNAYNGRLVRLLSSAFPSQKAFAQENSIKFGTHFLRSLYAMMMWAKYKNEKMCPSQTKFIGDILGHGDDFGPSKHYECIRLTGTDMPAKGVPELWNEEWDKPKPKPKPKKKVTVKEDVEVAPEKVTIKYTSHKKSTNVTSALPRLEDIKAESEGENEETDVDERDERSPSPKKQAKKKRPAPDSDNEEQQIEKKQKKEEKPKSDLKPKIGATRDLGGGYQAVCIRKQKSEDDNPWFIHRVMKGKPDNRKKMEFAFDLMLSLGNAGVVPDAKMLNKFGARLKSLTDEMQTKLITSYNEQCPLDMEFTGDSLV